MSHSFYGVYIYIYRLEQDGRSTSNSFSLFRRTPPHVSPYSPQHLRPLKVLEPSWKPIRLPRPVKNNRALRYIGTYTLPPKGRLRATGTAQLLFSIQPFIHSKCESPLLKLAQSNEEGSKPNQQQALAGTGQESAVGLVSLRRIAGVVIVCTQHKKGERPVTRGNMKLPRHRRRTPYVCEHRLAKIGYPC